MCRTLGNTCRELGNMCRELGNTCRSLGTRAESLGTRSEGLGTHAEIVGTRAEILGTRAEILGTRAERLGTRAEGLGTRAKGLGTSGMSLSPWRLESSPCCTVVSAGTVVGLHFLGFGVRVVQILRRRRTYYVELSVEIRYGCSAGFGGGVWGEQGACAAQSRRYNSRGETVRACAGRSGVASTIGIERDYRRFCFDADKSFFQHDCRQHQGGSRQEWV